MNTNNSNNVLYILGILFALFIGLIIGIALGQNNNGKEQPKEIAKDIYKYENKELYCFKPNGLLIANNPIQDAEYLCIWEEGATIRTN